MNRIDQLFAEKKEGILSIYLTAGFPQLNDTPRLISLLQSAGVDMAEIGIPFSDPLADGPVIQQSSHVALKNGMTLDLLFDQLKEIRRSVQMPLVLMGYLNPILRMGMEKVLDRCHLAGIDGLIIPDLPPAEFETSYREHFRSRSLYHTMLITPHTAEERIRYITGLSDGFLYMVADAATTGARDRIGEHQIAYFERIARMNLPLPALIGFGISSHETFSTACRYARGGIIGSAFIRALDGEGALEEKVGRFISSIRGTRESA